MDSKEEPQPVTFYKWVLLPQIPHTHTRKCFFCLHSALGKAAPASCWPLCSSGPWPTNRIKNFLFLNASFWQVVCWLLFHFHSDVKFRAKHGQCGMHFWSVSSKGLWPSLPPALLRHLLESGWSAFKVSQHHLDVGEVQQFGNCSQLVEKWFPSKLGGSLTALPSRNKLKYIEMVALTNNLTSHSTCFMYWL